MPTGQQHGQEEEELLEGTLLKRGGMFSGWKEKLFILTSLRLIYHDGANKSNAVKGTMMLVDVKAVDTLPEKKHGKRFCLAISSPGLTWVVRADTESDFDHWREALRNAISAARPKPFNGSARLQTSILESEEEKSLSSKGEAGQSGMQDSNKHGKLETKKMVKVAKSDSGRLQDVYKLGRVIDEGSNGKVLEGVDRRTGEKVAIKQIDLGASNEDEGQMEIWQQVQHENVVRLLDFYKTPSQLFFVMELAAGKDLFYGVMQHYHGSQPRGFSEIDAMDLTNQLMTALRHLHLRRIVHCDLKPENILLHEEGGRLKLKLADWGYAQVLTPGRPLERVLGTGSYMAPEILDTRPYDEKVDMWSAGVIFFVLLCGFPPYEAMYDSSDILDLQATLRMVQGQCSNGKWSYFPSPYWDRVSKEGKSFIQAFLTYEPSKRYSAEAILKHPWYAKMGRNNDKQQTSSTPSSASNMPLVGLMEQMRMFNASRARSVIEHCLGGALQHLKSGSGLAGAAVIGEEESQGHILEEEGWQPLISLAWSNNTEDRTIAITALANVSQSRQQAQRLVREGGLRVLLEATSNAVSDDILHAASIALSNLAHFSETQDALMKQGAHRHLVNISKRNSTACRYQAARALARLCTDQQWHQQLVAEGALASVVELSQQVLFESMQSDALRAISALARNEAIKDRVHQELRLTIKAAGKGKDPSTVTPPEAKLRSILESMENDTTPTFEKEISTDSMMRSISGLGSDRFESAKSDVGSAGEGETEIDITALDEIDPPEVFSGNSSYVQKMTLRKKKKHVAVKFVPLELVPAERGELLKEVGFNYSCGGEGAQSHHVIGFHGAFYEPKMKRLGIVMDFVIGGNLRELYVAAGRKLEEAALRSVMHQALDGLQFMHSRHIIHRDIKPSSLLIDTQGRLVIANLGNLRQLAKTNGQAASVVGTTCYFAPERIMGVAFTNTVDVWALGLTVLEAAIGVFPFKEYQHNYMKLLEHIVDCENPAHTVGKNLTPEFQKTLARCLQKQAKDRPTAKDLLATEAFLSQDVDGSRALLKQIARAHSFGTYSK